MTTRKLIQFILLALLLPSISIAQEFPPKKTVTMVVGFAAGGSADTAARVIAKKLGEDIGQAVVVDNRPGAGGNIAHGVVANGPTDGSMILLGSIGPLTIAPHMMKISYDPVKDLAPLTMGLMFPNILVVPPSLGVKSLKDLVALAKKEPGKLTFASTGSGSASHLQGELFDAVAGIDMVHVPYKGGNPAMIDVLSGRVSVYYSSPSTAGPFIKEGKLIPLAVTSSKRSPFYPKVPTIAESGYPGFDSTNWYAFMAPGKTPTPILDGWNKALVKVLSDKSVIAALGEHNFSPAPMSRADLAKFMAKESATWAKIIKDKNITEE
ncbi:tripartite tricarboxylate transporter substrate binding protein [Polynucleobacter sp. MWH-UH25E]|uniref:Bug family tripartite tricarboxylate transporter substrate binding protein n=1 Tax=Polynucleobacter sp. MWH-UH25E TaxID=1855616 RepID=UPI001BFD2777|nr:tripartite tricarboxylate transporter substrate binding protein [Polynucleobacter sp. MWH-UH25E]QWD63148.1 tripartite tricarboxylate transporter substrate binding protein [Polynucleobacter sp. MWH-UH25E]